MLKIGLTGSIAGGKSEVGRMLAKRGACVVDADRVAHQVYEPGGDAYAPLIQAFGPDILAPDGTIDRARLGQLVFADTERRRQLTDIVWPLVGQAVNRMAKQQEQAGTRIFVVEAPLLVDAGWQDYFDQVWLVRAPAAAVRTRLRTRGLDEAEIEARLAAATNPEAAAAIANVIIDNDGDLASLERAVEAAWQALPAS